MDLGFVLDASGSVGSLNYQLQLNFTKDLLRRVNVGPNKTHVGIINYSELAQTLTWLNTDYNLQQKLQQVDQAIYYSSGTNTALGLQQADVVFSYENGRRLAEQGVTTVIFVITDGASNNQVATLQAAAVLKAKNIILVSVGVGQGPNLLELHGICTPPFSENYFAISNYNGLDQKLNQFSSRACSEPVSVSTNTTLTFEIEKNKYKFLKVLISTNTDKMLITAKLFNGNVKLFYSFTNSNPKDPDDFINYESKTTGDYPALLSQTKAYVQQRLGKSNTGKNNEVTLVIDKLDDQLNQTFIGIKGIEETNNFEMSFSEDDEVIVSKTNVLKTTPSIILIIIFGLFLR